MIRLPDEPYAFGSRDTQELAALRGCAAESGRIQLIDGTLVMGYGPPVRTAVEALQSLLEPCLERRLDPRQDARLDARPG